MFGVDFSEMMVIMLVALVVIGPERLPKVARTMGNLWGRAQRFVNNVKSDISRDMAIEEYLKLQKDIQEQASSLGQTLKESTDGLGQEVQQLNDSLQQPEQEATQKQNPVGDAKDENLPARSVPAGAPAPRKPNLCAIVDKVIAAGTSLEEEPEFQALSGAEQENARKLHAQEEKVHGIRNKAYEEIERAKKIAALEQAKAEAKAKAEAQQTAQAQETEQAAPPLHLSPEPEELVLTQAQDNPQALPEQKKFLVD